MAFLDSNNGPIYYNILNCTSPWQQHPDTIVFQHGLGACGLCWSGWIPALVANYRLAFVDLRGHGQSPVSDSYRWSLDGMVGDLDAVINTLVPGSGRCHLVGESIGGTIALAYAVAHSKRLQSLTVCNGAHAGGGLNNLANWRELTANGGMAAWSEHMLTMRFYDDQLTATQRDWYRAQQATCDQRSVLAAVEVLADADLSDQLSQILVPVLLLHPDSSPFIPLSVMADLKNRLPDARLNVFADARHGLPFSHAAECSAALLRFLSSVKGSVEN